MRCSPRHRTRLLVFAFLLLLDPRLVLGEQPENFDREVWNRVVAAAEAVRELVSLQPDNHPEIIESAKAIALHRIRRLRTERPEKLEAVRRYLYSPDGLTGSTELVRSLTEIADAVTDPARDEGQVQSWLDDIHFDELKGRLDNPKLLDELEGRGGLESVAFAAPREVKKEKNGLLRFLGFGKSRPHPEPTPLSEQVELSQLESAVVTHMESLRRFDHAALGVKSSAVTLHTLFLGIAALTAIKSGVDPQVLHTLTPREVVGVLAGAWAGNRVSFSLLWEKTGLLKFLQERMPGLPRRRFKAVTRSWEALMRKAPRLAPETVVAAAQEKPVSLESKVGSEEDAALQALINQKGPKTTELLERLAKYSLSKGWSARARGDYVELKARGEASPEQYPGLASRAEAVIEFIDIKRRIEHKILARQVRNALLRTSLLALATGGTSHAVAVTVPHKVSQWRGVALAVASGLVGPKRIVDYIWRAPSVREMGSSIESDRADLLKAGHKVMEADRSGDILAAIAEWAQDNTSQDIVFDAILDAFRQTTGTEVTATMVQMVQRRLTAQAAHNPRVANLVRATFDQYRSCLRQMARLTSTGGAATAP